MLHFQYSMEVATRSQKIQNNSNFCLGSVLGKNHESLPFDTEVLKSTTCMSLYISYVFMLYSRRCPGSRSCCRYKSGLFGSSSALPLYFGLHVVPPSEVRARAEKARSSAGDYRHYGFSALSYAQGSLAATPTTSVLLQARPPKPSGESWLHRG